MKGALQICLMVLVLLAQTAPMMVLSAPCPEKCTMACCAWLEEEGLGDCSCEAAPSEPGQPQPASPHSPSGRDGACQVLWAEVAPPFQHITFSPRETGPSLRPALHQHTDTSPHVRRSVLFCSFLT